MLTQGRVLFLYFLKLTAKTLGFFQVVCYIAGLAAQLKGRYFSPVDSSWALVYDGNEVNVMENNEQAAFLKNELEALIAGYKKDRNRHKYTALFITISIATLSSLAVVILGWKSPPDPVLFNNIALVFNASIAVISTYEAFFRPKKLWVRETLVYSKLKDIERDLAFDSAAGSLSAEQLEQYKQQINKILEISLNQWLGEKKNEE